jgi:hypothetical protein
MIIILEAAHYALFDLSSSKRLHTFCIFIIMGRYCVALAFCGV